MKGPRFCLIAAGLVFGSAMLSAQDTEIGSRIKRPENVGTVRTPKQAILNSHRLADCLANVRRPLIVKFLSERSPEALVVARRNLMREIYCTNMLDYGEFNNGENFALPPELLRGLLAEAMIVGNGSSSLPEPLKIQRTYVAWWSSVSGRQAAIDEMAVCLADTNPRAILNLLHTASQSDAERSAFDQLTPSMTQCLASNVNLTGNRQTLRAALAEALYHRMNDNSQASPTGGKN